MKSTVTFRSYAAILSLVLPIGSLAWLIVPITYGQAAEPDLPRDRVAGEAPGKHTQQPAPTGHLETPDQPPAPASPRRISPPPVVTRGGFVSVQVNVDELGNNMVGDAANEPSIAVDPTNPNVIVIGWRQFDSIASSFRQAGWAYSHNAGRTWTFPGVLEPGVFRSDPVLDCDSEGNICYYSLQGDFLCDLFKSADGGVSWDGPLFAYGGDKAWMIVDKTDSVGHGHHYVSWSRYGNNYYPNQFTRSTDGGTTWLYPVQIPPLQPMWGTLAVDLDGNLYIGGYDYPTDMMIVAKSTNAKLADQTPTFDFSLYVDLGGPLVFQAAPNPGGLLGQLWLAVDQSDGPTAGNVYMLASVDPTGPDPTDVMFVRSEDGGQTWSSPVRVNDDPPGTNAWQWFGTMSVAPDGRIDAVWNDTRNSGQANICELFYASSTDGGVTWSENIPLSPPFNSHLGWPQQDKLGDYYHMVSDVVGANLAWAATFNGEQDVYFLRIGDFDCNGNGIGDAEDLASGTSDDSNGNGIPDECDCLGDLNGDWMVDLTDLATLLSNYGTTSGASYEDGDIDGDGDVDLADLAALLSNYGMTCP
ncbi:MAG: hypothetical protein ACE5I3_04345 [Phycisphaerae bacterium]